MDGGVAMCRAHTMPAPPTHAFLLAAASFSRWRMATPYGFMCISTMVFTLPAPVNGASTLEEVHRRVVAVMEAVGDPFEMIFVDDGSRDRSWDVIRSLAEADDRLLGLSLMRNYSQPNATMAGLRHARGDFLVTIDDD